MLAVATLTAALYEIVIHRYKRWLGLGGRLGFVAWLASNIAAILHGSPHPALHIPVTLSAWIAIVKASPAFYACTCAALGSVATITLREYAEVSNSDNGMQDPVRAATTVGIIASLCLGIFGLDSFGACVVLGGAFSGMSLPSRLLKGVVPGRKKRNPPGPLAIVVYYAAAGALGGLIHALSVPLNWWTGGIWGGKSGVCAFAGVLIFRGLEKIVYWIREKMGWTSEIVDYGELY
jgi:hypothetical protein